MPKYQIFTSFKTDGWIEVEADTVKQAVELAKNSNVLDVLHKEETVTVDLTNSYEWVGDFINDWTELTEAEATPEQEMRYVQIIIQSE